MAQQRLRFRVTVKRAVGNASGLHPLGYVEDSVNIYDPATRVLVTDTGDLLFHNDFGGLERAYGVGTWVNFTKSRED